MGKQLLQCVPSVAETRRMGDSEGESDKLDRTDSTVIGGGEGGGTDFPRASSCIPYPPLV